MAADEIIIETTSQQVIEVSSPGPQGPRGADGTGLETLTTKGDTLYRGQTTGERLPIGTTGQILRVSSSGLPEWGAAPASGVSSVAGKTGAVSLDSTDIFTEQALQISDAGVADCNGVFVYGGLFNNRATYYATKDTFVYWDGSNWVINHNGNDQYFGTATTYPWQAVWSLGDGANPLPVVTQAAAHEFEQIVGQRTNPTARGDAASKNVGTGANDVAAGNDARFSDARQPLAHSSTHHTGGTDAIAPNQISAAWALVLSQQTITGNTVLSAGRNRRITLFAVGATANVDLPHENNQAGDSVTLVGNFSVASTLTIRRASVMGGSSPVAYGTLATLNASGQSFTFVSDGSATGWSLRAVDSHTHPSTQVTGLGTAATADSTDFAAATHAASHAAGGSDPLFDQDLNTTNDVIFNSATLNTLLVPNGLSGIDVPFNGVVQIVDELTTGSPFADFVANNNLSANRTYDLPDRSGELMLVGDAPASHTHTPSEVGLGNVSNAAQVTSVSGTAPIVSSGGTTPAISITAATTSAAGSMSAADKTKLDSVESGATANSSDATLLARANHTGTQAANTITGLAASATTDTTNASNITSGTLAPARMGSGTPSASNFLRGDGSWQTVAGGGVTTGSVDNAVIRADGVGGSTSQGSDLVIDDAVAAFNITGDAGTDIITAVGHNFTANQGVRFPTLTGGAGLTAATTNYFVRDISGDTFRVSTTSGGTAVNFTTNITAGNVIAMQANVAIRNNSSETDSALVLTPKGAGPILRQRPDGTTVGGNIRGQSALDFQGTRNAVTQVASGLRAVVLSGINNTASGQDACVISAQSNTASGTSSFIAGSSSSTASGDGTVILASGNGSTASNNTSIVLQGFQTTASGAQSIAMGQYALADRAGMMARAYFTYSVAGDAQRAWYSPLFNKTSTATATELFIDGSAIRLTIPSGKTISMLINIVAATSGGEFANRYVRAVTIANRGGTTALRGAVKDIDTEEQITGADVTISANDTNDALRVEFSGVAPVTGCTAAASTDVISKTAHGFSNNDDIVFTLLTGGAGLTANTVTYWVINATADTFQVSATRGGAAVNITTDYSAMTAARLFRVVAYVDGAEVAFGT